MSLRASMIFGTMEYSDQPADLLYNATLQAIRAGCRHFDTGEEYTTPFHVGRAITDSKVPRAEIYLISKLRGLPSGEYQEIKARMTALLANLQVDHVDLLLMHWPGPSAVDLSASPGTVEQQCAFTTFESLLVPAWQNMLALKAEGLCTNIGVSNFYEAHLQRLLQNFPDTLDHPVANQIFIDPLHQESKYVAHMATLGIHVIAYRNCTFLPVYEMIAGMGDGTLAALTQAAQASGYTHLRSFVCAWLLRRGVSVMFKTRSLERVQTALSLRADEAIGDIPLDSLQALSVEGAADMAEMCGGLDEYAATFKRISLAAIASDHVE